MGNAPLLLSWFNANYLRVHSVCAVMYDRRERYGRSDHNTRLGASEGDDGEYKHLVESDRSVRRN